MRQEILADSLPLGIEEFQQQFALIAEPFQMDWELTDSAEKAGLI